MITVTDEPTCKYLISQGQMTQFLPDRDVIGRRAEIAANPFWADPIPELKLKGCPRKWALHYLAGVPRGTSPALEFGTESHTCLEELTTRADWPERWPSHWTNKEPTAAERTTAKIAVLSVAMYTHRPPGTFIAEPTYYLNVPDLDEGGTSFHIRPDGWADRKVFVDWKTTSSTVSSSPWVLHNVEEESTLQGFHGKYWQDFYSPIATDIQANLYAFGLMTKWHTQSIKGSWIYGSKKFSPGQMPKTWDTSHDFSLRAASDFFDRVIRPTALVMNQIRRGIESKAIDSALLVPHVQESCDHRGKFCEAFGFCNLVESPVQLAQLGLPIPKQNMTKKIVTPVKLRERTHEDVIQPPLPGQSAQNESKPK